jgi:hypothetical protein
MEVRMGLMFLPWEKLPGWLVGLLTTASGVFLVLHAEPYSWRQFEAAAFTIIGTAIFIYSIKELRAKAKGDAIAAGGEDA